MAPELPTAPAADSESSNPFAGLRPIVDPNALFGRDPDFTVVRERIYSARTTLLFAPSGAGKTSFLLAKVLPDLKEEFTGLLHSDWADLDPRQAVSKAICSALKDVAHDPEKPMVSFLEGFRRRPATTGFSTDLPLRPERGREKEFLLVLDQFEEIFQYWSFRPELQRFLDELCGIISAANLKVRVLISMRDDFLGHLSAFDNRIPDLFNNYYRLKYPTKSQAIDVIQRTSRGAAPAGLRDLVEDLSKFRRTVNESQSGPNLDPDILTMALAVQRVLRPFRWVFRLLFPKEQDRVPTSEELDRDLIIPPYLQIVCYELWERRKTDVLFLSDYGLSRTQAVAEPAGAKARSNPAADILEEFCKEKLDQLRSNRQKLLAAKAFDFLVTREGAKMAYQLKGLSRHMDVNSLELEPVLTKLSESRILRRFKGADSAWWYELYHDMYAPILYEWKRRYQKQRNRRTRTWIRAAVVTAAVVIFWLGPTIHDISLIHNSVSDYPVAAYNSLVSRLTIGGLIEPFRRWGADRVWAAYWDRRAEQAELAEDRDRAALLRLEALKSLSNNRRAAAAARIAGGEYSDNLRLTLRVPSAAIVLAFSQDEKRLFAAGQGFGQVWDIKTGAPGPGATDMHALEALNERLKELRVAAFLGEDRLLTLGHDGVLEFWMARPEIKPERFCLGVTAFELDRGHENIFVALNDGTVHRWPLESLDKQCPNTNVPSFKTTPTAAGVGRTTLKSTTVEKIVISKDGSTLLTTTNRGSVEQRSIRDGGLLKVIVPSAVSAAISADGSRIAVIKQRTESSLSITHLDSLGRQLKRIDIEVDDSEMLYTSVHLNVDGSLVELSSSIRDRLFEANSGKLVFEASISFSSAGAEMGGPVIAYARDEGIVSLFVCSPWRRLEPIRVNASMLESSSRGTYLASAAETVIRVWNTEPRRLEPEYRQGSGSSSLLTLSEDGSCAATFDGKRVVFRRIDPPEEIYATDVNPQPLMIRVSRGCRRGAAAWPDGKIRLWDLAGHVEVGSKVSHGSEIRGLLFSPDSNRMLSYDFKSSVLWDTADGHRIQTVSQGGTGWTFTPDSRMFYSTRHGDIHWAQSGKPTGLVTPEGARIYSAFGSMTSFMAVGANDGVYVTDLMQGSRFTKVFDSPRVTSVAVDPKMSDIAAIAGGSLYIHRERIPRQRQEKPDVKVGQDLALVRFCQHSPKWLLTTSRGGALQLRDAETGGAIGSPALVQSAFSESGSRFVSPEFTPDGKSLLVATSRWVHLLRVTDAGLQPYRSRQLSGFVRSAGSVHIMNPSGSRVVVAVALGDFASRLEIIDFEDDASQPALKLYDQKTWERKLGLHLEQGEIVPNASR